MNTETGQIYRDREIFEAIARGEPVVPVSEKVAEAVEVGMAQLNRRARRRQAALERRRPKPQRKRR